MGWGMAGSPAARHPCDVLPQESCNRYPDAIRHARTFDNDSYVNCNAIVVCFWQEFAILLARS